MPSKGGFQLTVGDIEILSWVYQCRLVTIDHLLALTGRTQTRINRRLLGLVKHGYLYRKRATPFDKYVYTKALGIRESPIQIPIKTLKNHFLGCSVCK